MIGSFGSFRPASAPSIRVPHPVRIGARLMGQFLLLVGVYYVGAVLVRTTGVPLPGNLVGMLLLLGLLRLGVVRLEHVEDAATLVLQHLNLFFISLAVGLMAWGGLLGASGAVLGACLAASAAVCLAVAGLVGQRLVRPGGGSDAP